jgi:hypothetical protein
MKTVTTPTAISQGHPARTLPIKFDLLPASISLSISGMVLPSITITCPDHNSSSVYLDSFTSLTSENTGASSIEERQSMPPAGSETGTWAQSHTLRGTYGQGVRVTSGCDIHADKDTVQWATIEKSTPDGAWVPLISRGEFADFYQPVLTLWRGRANMEALRLRLLEAWDNLLANGTSKGLPSWIEKHDIVPMEEKTFGAPHWDSEVQKLMNEEVSLERRRRFEIKEIV